MPKMVVILTHSERLFVVNSDNLQTVLETKSFEPTQKNFGLDLQSPVFLTPGEIVEIPARVKSVAKVCHTTPELTILVERTSEEESKEASEPITEAFVLTDILHDDPS